MSDEQSGPSGVAADRPNEMKRELTKPKRSSIEWAVGWWITTFGALEILMGPFATREGAMRARLYVERVENRSDLWVRTAAELHEGSRDAR